MIRVRVTPPPGWKRKKLDERGWIELPDGARLADALKAIHMPNLIARMLIVSVNGAVSKPDRELCDGDSISFFPLASGG